MTDISLRSNLESRYWTQALGVSRIELEEAVAVVGSNVEAVMRFLGLPERRKLDDAALAGEVPLE